MKLLKVVSIFFIAAVSSVLVSEAVLRRGKPVRRAFWFKKRRFSTTPPSMREESAPVSSVHAGETNKYMGRDKFGRDIRGTVSSDGSYGSISFGGF